MPEETTNDELPELEDIIELMVTNTERLKRDLASKQLDTGSELVETFLPLVLDGLRAAAARISVIEDEVFPIKLSEDEVMEIADALQEARAKVAPIDQSLAIRLGGIAEQLIGEISADEEDEEPN